MTNKNVIIEISAGGIVFRQFGSKKKIALLKKKGKKEQWVLPKGKIDKGESVEDAAKREVKEETGLSDLKVITKLGKENYFYRRVWKDKKLVAKTVYYFLMENRKGRFLPQEEEGFEEARWFDLEEAILKAAFKETKKNLQNAIKYLKENYEKF